LTIKLKTAFRYWRYLERSKGTGMAKLRHDIDNQEIVRMLKAGHTIIEISRYFDCSTFTVSDRAKKAGWICQGRQYRDRLDEKSKQARANEIIRMLKNNIHIPDIAKHFKMSPYTARQIAKKQGWVFTLGGYRGKREKPLVQETPMETPEIKRKKVCTCCGKRPVPTKQLPNGVWLTRLCSICYHKAQEMSDRDRLTWEPRYAIVGR